MIFKEKIIEGVFGEVAIGFFTRFISGLFLLPLILIGLAGAIGKSLFEKDPPPAKSKWISRGGIEREVTE